MIYFNGEGIILCAVCAHEWKLDDSKSGTVYCPKCGHAYGIVFGNDAESCKIENCHFE